MTGIEQAIFAAGSQSALARAVGTSQQNVYHWLISGFVPTRWVQAVEQATGISRDQLIKPSLVSLLSSSEL